MYCSQHCYSDAESGTNGGINCDFTFSVVLFLVFFGFELSLVEVNGMVIDYVVLLGNVFDGESLALKHPGYNNVNRYSWKNSFGTLGITNVGDGD